MLVILEDCSSYQDWSGILAATQLSSHGCTDTESFFLEDFVAEEILVIQKKKRPADLWSVLAALVRMSYIRHERLRDELIIWRGRAAEEAVGLAPSE